MLMSGQIVLLLSLSLFNISLIAQQDSVRFSNDYMHSKYQNETIYLQLNTYTKDNKAHDLGMFGGGLTNEMKVSPDAMVIFKKYQKQKVWSFVCAGLQMATEIAAFSTPNRSRRTALQIGGGVISIVSVPLYFGSTKNLNKAVWIRNEKVLKWPDPVPETHDLISFESKVPSTN
jgi:hypothetical protein